MTKLSGPLQLQQTVTCLKSCPECIPIKRISKRLTSHTRTSKWKASRLSFLRHTFATMLHANGANQAVAMKAMRHSDPKLTAVTYNDSNLLPVANAVNQLPSVVSKAKEKPSWTRRYTIGHTFQAWDIFQCLKVTHRKNVRSLVRSLSVRKRVVI